MNWTIEKYKELQLMLKEVEAISKDPRLEADDDFEPDDVADERIETLCMMQEISREWLNRIEPGRAIVAKYENGNELVVQHSMEDWVEITAELPHGNLVLYTDGDALVACGEHDEPFVMEHKAGRMHMKFLAPAENGDTLCGKCGATLAKKTTKE